MALFGTPDLILLQYQLGSCRPRFFFFFLLCQIVCIELLIIFCKHGMLMIMPSMMPSITILILTKDSNHPVMPHTSLANKITDHTLYIFMITQQS